MRSVSLKLPDNLAKKLEVAAKKRRLNKSAVIREALEAYFADEKRPIKGSFAELAGDLIGCIKGGPPDLATNPKYMEGYGR